MKRTLVLAILLTGCHTREDISKRQKCLFHDYQKIPYCKNFNFLPADKIEKPTKANEQEVLQLKYSAVENAPNYDLIFDAEPLLAN